MIVATAGCALALLVNSVLSQYYVAGNEETTNPNGNALRAMVAMNFPFSFFFTMIGIITWVYPAEIFSTEIRARGNSLSTMSNWILNLIFAQFSPTALASVGFRYFYAFFVFNLCAVICYIFLYPETAGRTLEQMDELFGDQLVPHALENPEKARAVMMERFGSVSETRQAV
ncbi:hypothetical protein LTR56_002760 [Elasticomyces elasticus]|nr:hypothetical protein LTR56_002760 [Elasticomyces elasticus]KAK3666783.1 hypothetical protein LTR22_002370 [Elasticomyces elasticus]KAK4918807.1 hypothetical protein LTR49_013438 [Elasticomyces elasticus]KAK5758724.1 hypothetical protein LTS12_011118 [Elasticomyces elasticus]